MSHDLRTPMNAVQGFARLMAEDTLGGGLSERQRKRLARIDAASQQVVALIDSLLQIAQQATPVTVPPPHKSTQLDVLCVEDNPVKLQLVRELLALRPAVRLRAAEDGSTGVAAALAAPPDLILLDMQLPDIDGLEVLRSVRAAPQMARCRIVALPADAMPSHIEAALAAGFDEDWTKPIQFDTFLAHIDQLVAAQSSTAA